MPVTSTTEVGRLPETLIGGCKYQQAANGPVLFALAMASPASQAINIIPSDFFPHGFAVHPVHRQRVAAFEKIGTGAALFDLTAKSIIKVIPALPGRQFYGHGSYSASGDLLYATETILASQQGCISIRDGHTLDYLDDFPTYGEHPHDCHLIDNGKTLVVTNGGGAAGGDQPSICYIDVESRKLLEQLPVPGTRINAGHIDPYHRNDIVLVSAPRRGLGSDATGGICFRRDAGPLTQIVDPESLTRRFAGEALSVLAIPDRNVFFATHPTPGLLTCWSLDSAQPRQHFALEQVRGVALSIDGRNVYVTWGLDTRLSVIDLDRQPWTVRDVLRGSHISGSHLLNWSKMN